MDMLSKQLLEDINQVVNSQFYTYINIQRLNEAIENGEELIDFDELLTEEASKCGLAAGKIASVLKKHLKVVNPLTVGLILVLSGQAGCVGKNLPLVLKHSDNLSKKIENSPTASKIATKSKYLLGDQAKKYPKSSQNKMMRDSEYDLGGYENLDPAKSKIEARTPRGNALATYQKTESNNDRLALYADRLITDIVRPKINKAGGNPEKMLKLIDEIIKNKSIGKNSLADKLDSKFDKIKELTASDKDYLNKLLNWTSLYHDRKKEIEKTGKPKTKLPDFPTPPKELANQFKARNKLDVFSKGDTYFYHNLTVSSGMRFSAAGNYPSIERALREGNVPASLSKVIEKELSGIKNKKLIQFVTIQKDINLENKPGRRKYAKGLLGVTFSYASGPGTADIVYVPNIDFTELSVYTKIRGKSWHCVDIVNLKNYTGYLDHLKKYEPELYKEFQEKHKNLSSFYTGENDEILNVKKMKTLFQVLPMLMHVDFSSSPDNARRQIERDEDDKPNKLRPKFLNVRPYI